MSSLAQNSKPRAIRSMVGAILMAIFQLTPWGGFSIFMMPLSESLGLPMASISLVWTLSAVGGLILALTVGSLIKKVGPKPLIVLGSVTLALFFITVGTATSIVPLLIASLLHGVGAVTAGFAMAQITVSSWFDKARGTMLSVLSVCMAIGTTVLIPVFAIFIQNYGYRNTAIGIGIVCGAACLLVGLLLISDHPSKYGLQPYGYVEREATEEDAASRAPLKFMQIAKFGPFWLVFIAAIMAGMANQAYNSQGSNFYQSIGLSPVDASFAMSIFSGAGIAWNLLFGLVSDRKSPMVASLINGTVCAIIMILSFLLLGWTGAIIAAICFAAGTAMGSLLAPTMMTSLFGNKEAGNLVGFSRAGGAIGSMVASPLSGAIFDATGSYSNMFLMGGIFLIICLVLMVAVGNKKSKAKMQKRSAEMLAKIRAENASAPETTT